MTKQTFTTVATRQATGDEPSMLISTISLDRDGDEIVPEGGEFGPYLRNPVIGWQHFREDAMPIGSTVRLTVEPGQGVRATWRWLDGDPLAARVRNAFEQGVVRAASIGFMPLEWTDIRETRGVRYTRWELTEWSLVAIPSNRQAVRTLKGLGLWDDDESVLDIVDEGASVLDVDLTPAESRALDKLLMNPARLVGLTGPPDEIDIDPATLRRALREANIPAAVNSALRDAVARELRVRRGRVD